MEYVPLDDERITVAESAIGLTATKLTKQTRFALVQCLVAPVRISITGTAPVGGSVGPRLAVGQFIEVWGPALAAFRAIRDTATSGKLEVIYFGAGS